MISVESTPFFADMDWKSAEKIITEENLQIVPIKFWLTATSLPYYHLLELMTFFLQSNLLQRFEPYNQCQ